MRCWAVIVGTKTTAFSRLGMWQSVGVCSMRPLSNLSAPSAQTLIVQPIVNRPTVVQAGFVLPHHSTVSGPEIVFGPGVWTAGQPVPIARHHVKFGS